MKMSKNYKKICLVLGLGTALCATVVDAANYTKTLKATYKDIKVTHNGTAKTLSTEPFLVDGSTYVPLRAVSEILGADVKWDNNTSTVAITGGQGDTTSLQQELATKNYQITTLTRQVEELKAELAEYKGSSASSETLSDALAYIEENYSDSLDIYWNVDLEKKNSHVELTLSFDSAKDSRNFDELSSRKISDFVKSIVEELRTFTELKNIEIKGTIEDNRNDCTKARFSYNKSNKFSFSLTSDDYEAFENELEDDYRDFKQLEYNTVVENVSKTANFDLPINSIVLEEKGGEITFTVSVSLNKYITQWNNLTQKGKEEIEVVLEEIKDDIEYEFDLDVKGVIVNSDKSNAEIATMGVNNRFKYYQAN